MPDYLHVEEEDGSGYTKIISTGRPDFNGENVLKKRPQYRD